MSTDDRLGMERDFRAWIDGALDAHIPDEANAFSFNLYEHPQSFTVELVGSPRYDPDNSDWACEEVFAYRDPLFEIPHSIIGSDWRQALNTISELVKRHLRTVAGNRLSRAEAVTVGLVDGDLRLVWANGSEAEPSIAE